VCPYGHAHYQCEAEFGDPVRVYWDWVYQEAEDPDEGVDGCEKVSEVAENMEGALKGQTPLRLDGPKGAGEIDDQYPDHEGRQIQRLPSPNERRGIALDLLPVVVKGEQQRCVLQ